MAVSLYDHIENTIDILHREWCALLRLDEAVDLLTKFTGGILLHVELLENDVPVVLLQFSLIALVGDGGGVFALGLSAKGDRESAIGLTLLACLAGLGVGDSLEVVEVGHLIDALRHIHNLVEHADS